MSRTDPGRHVAATVLVPFVLALAALAGMAVGGFALLSAARAYVAGESQWSKGRSSGVAALRAYAATGAEGDFQRFERALAVPLGDRRARLELDKAEPDYAIVREGFIAGRNAPEDIGGMIRLYRWFGEVGFMREAISAWANGDALIAELQAIGAEARERAAHGVGPDPRLSMRIDAVNVSLLEAERRFTASLGVASRTSERLLLGITLAIAALLGVGMTWFVRRTLQEQVEGRRLLLEANRRWALAADAAGIGVFEWLRDEDRFVLDPRGRALYGYDDEPALDRAALRERIHPDDRTGVQAAWDAALVGDEPFHHRFRIQRPDGSVRHVESIGVVRNRPVGPSGQRVIGILRDITDELERARLGAEKQAAERIAQARMAFLSRLSHELRTPLNAVLGIAQLLRIDAGEPMTAGQAHRVAIIERSGLQLLHLVEDVLDITRIDSGALRLTLEPTDVGEVLRASIALVEPERAVYGTRIVDQLPLEPLRVLADANRLRQVFVNLLSNACKYNRPNGRVVVDAAREDDLVRIAFADEGPGLTEAERGELFQPFKRLHAASKVPGTGLGLVVVKLVVEQMGGAVEVASTPGQGAHFVVSLPAA